MKVYTASSVGSALRAINTSAGIPISVSGVDELVCPITGKTSVGFGVKCFGDPKYCHGARTQTCKRRVRVFVNDNKGFSYDLYFFFTISVDNNDGFIDKDDSTLRWLIDDKGAIDESVLEVIEL